MLNHEEEEPTTSTLLGLSLSVAMLILFVLKLIYGQNRLGWWYAVYFLLLLIACIRIIFGKNKATEKKTR